MNACMRPGPLFALHVPFVALLASAGIAGIAGCSSTNASPQADAGASTDGTAAASTWAPCDPLAPPPITVANILGVGKDAQGTIYVADLPPGVSEPRVYISDGTALRRAHVAGSGSSGSGATAVYNLTYEILGKPSSVSQGLIVQMNGATAASMALSSDQKSFSGGTPLTLVDATAIAGLTVVNLPGIVDYLGDVSDGTVLVITSPMDISPSFEPHLFYGPPSDAIERSITDFNQSLSGYPRVTFTVDAASDVMTISGTSTGVAGTSTGPGPGTLTTATGTLAFTVRTPTPTNLDGMSFKCLTP